MTTPIGLLVVHGIGHQHRGDLSREISEVLADAMDESMTPVRRIVVKDVPVHVTEAYWAEISDPDNVPELRFGGGVLTEFLDTVSAAWFSLFPFLTSSNQNGRRASRYFWLVGILAILATLVLVLLVREYSFEVVEAWFNEHFSVISIPFTVLMLYFMFWYVRHELRHKMSTIPNDHKIQRHLLQLFWLPVIFFVGYIKFLVLLMVIVISAEVLVFLFIACMAVVPFNYLLMMPVMVIQDVSNALNMIAWQRPRLWLHRLAWVMIVLPMHSLLQVVKSWGNLLSIMFTNKSFSVRSAALAAALGVCLAFLVLVIFCELLIIPGVSPYLLDTDGPVTTPNQTYNVIWVISLILWTAAYLGFLKLLLPAIDLVLDIDNYHLADDAERRRYFLPIEAGVADLISSGVEEIHILAHSLGTVITYDWLQGSADITVPVTVLHTIGSPLDKFWYLDHTRQKRQADGQGVPVKRLSSWVNYWAWSDPVSGQLDHYSTLNGAIENIRLRWLGPFLTSHVAYWKNHKVIESIRAHLSRN